MDSGSSFCQISDQGTVGRIDLVFINSRQLCNPLARQTFVDSRANELVTRQFHVTRLQFPPGQDPPAVATSVPLTRLDASLARRAWASAARAHYECSMPSTDPGIPLSSSVQSWGTSQLYLQRAGRQAKHLAAQGLTVTLTVGQLPTKCNSGNGLSGCPPRRAQARFNIKNQC